LRAVQKIICYNGNITLINSNTGTAVQSHISKLLQKLDNSHLEITKLINDRIKSLSGKCVLINVGLNTCSASEDIIMQEVDVGLKTVTSAIKWGVIDIKNMPALTLKKLGIENQDVILSSLPYAVDKFTKSFLKQMTSLDIAIVCDSKEAGKINVTRY
jgi:hypothetical protein